MGMQTALIAHKGGHSTDQDFKSLSQNQTVCSLQFQWIEPQTVYDLGT